MTDTSAMTALTADELPLEEEYRPLSALCVVALLAGLASPLSLVHPLLVVVPLASAALALVALRSLATAAQPVTGQRLAVAGLCLAMLFLGWGIAKRLHHRAVVRASAREFADDWLRVLATGDRYRAHQMHAAREFRVDPHAQIEQLYAINASATSSMNTFFENPAVQKFLAAGRGVKFRFVEVARQSQNQLADIVVLRYEIEAKDRFPMWITVRRTFRNALHDTDWELHDIEHQPQAVE